MFGEGYRTDVIYHWESPDGDNEMFFFSPDGIGRIFYDTLSEAKENSGLDQVIRTDILSD